MKKILAALILVTSTMTAEANIPPPSEARPIEPEVTMQLNIEWHPTSVVLGALTGGAVVGGLTAVVVGGILGELTIRWIKNRREKKQDRDVEAENTNGKIEAAEGATNGS